MKKTLLTTLCLTVFLAITPTFSRAFPADFDLDGKADAVVYRPNFGIWYVYPSSGICPHPSTPTGFGGCQLQWGLSGDIPLTGDYDGDGKTDYTVFRPSTGTWYIRYSSTDAVTFMGQFGLSGDIPDEGETTGDARSDLILYRPGEARFYVRNSTTQAISYISVPPPPNSGTYPPEYSLVGNWLIPNGTHYLYDEFDRCFKFRDTQGNIQGEFTIIDTDGSSRSNLFRYMQPEDIPVSANFGGSTAGANDYVWWKPSNGTWYIEYAGGGGTVPYPATVQWGLSGDIPLPRDFDGDGLADLTVWRPANGTWYVKTSTGGCPSYMAQVTGGCSLQWGAPGDIPVN